MSGQITTTTNDITSNPNVISTSDPSESAVTTESGWNYGLTDPVIASPFPDQANYFSTGGDIGPDTPHWTVAVESENGPGDSEPGPACQSFPITNITGHPDEPAGVTALQIVPTVNMDGNAADSVELKTDLYDYTQPAGAGYYTWYAFGENTAQGGGPLPAPNVAEFDVNLLYNAWLPNAGARVSVMWQAYWNGQSFELEMDLNRQSDAWGVNTGTFVQYTRTSPGVTYLQLNGAALGLTLIPGEETAVHIDWGSIIQTLVAQNILPAPVGGWSNSVSQAAYVTTEMDNQSATRAGTTDLWINSYAASSSSAGDPSTLTTAAGDTMFNLTTYSTGAVLTDSTTGAVVQNLPPTAADTLRFISVDSRTYGTNLASAASLGLDPRQLRDYDGNLLGTTGQWDMLGLATVQPGAAPSYILVDPATGRWAEVAARANTTFNFQNNGDNGDTRIVGTYLDPLVTAGIVVAGSPTDSQVRFLADVEANRLALLGSVYDQTDGGMDLIFKQTNYDGNQQNAVYLRAILHTDGNIQYANYMNSAQFNQWAASADIPSAVTTGWMTKI